VTRAPFDWPEPGAYGLVTAQSPDGQWSLRPGSGEVRIVFHPNLPDSPGPRESEEGRDHWFKEWQAYASHPGKAAHTAAYQKAGHHFGIGNDEAMMAETMEEARMLVEAMVEGDGVLLSCEDQLRAAGFAVKHPGHEGLDHLWSRRIRSGSMDVSLKDTPEERSAWITYHGDGASNWHNLVHVSERWQGHSTTVHHSFPQQVRDPLRVAVAHALRVMELRLERGGRFSKPLGEVVKRPTR
jgi:hypothetical protein